MANDRDPADRERDVLAERFYVERVAQSPNPASEMDVFAAYRAADAFLAGRAKVKTGALQKQAEAGGIELADCWAPNLKRTHPHNLVSQQCGDLVTVNRVKKWLDANPTPESDPLDLVHRFRQAHPGYDWDLPTINTARAIFPAYCKN